MSENSRFSIQPLNEKSLKVAEKELNENQKRYKNDIEILRSWLKQQPHLKSIQTDEFLLRFLRASKYSILKAEERLENFWLHRTELPQWFKNVDITDPLMQEINDLCYSMPLPEATDENCRVILVRTGCWSTSKYELNDIMKYAFLVTDVVNKDPRIQVHGWVGLIDFAGITMGHAQQMTHSFIKNAVKCWQETYPGRIKNIHFINYPKFFDVTISIIKMFLKDKIKDRVIFHGSDIKSLHKYLPKRILPSQYGGTAGDLFELNELWRNELINNREYLEELENCGVNVNLMSQIKKQDKNNTFETTSGTYRKLNND